MILYCGINTFAHFRSSQRLIVQPARRMQQYDYTARDREAAAQNAPEKHEKRPLRP